MSKQIKVRLDVTEPLALTFNRESALLLVADIISEMNDPSFTKQVIEEALNTL